MTSAEVGAAKPDARLFAAALARRGRRRGRGAPCRGLLRGGFRGGASRRVGRRLARPRGRLGGCAGRSHDRVAGRAAVSGGALEAGRAAVNGSERWKPWFGPAALVGGLIIAVIGGAVVVLVAQGGAAAHTTQLSPGETDVATLIQDLAFVGVAVALAQTVGRVTPSQFGLGPPRDRWRAAVLVVGGLVAFFVISAVWLTALHVSGEETAAGQGHRRVRRHARRARRLCRDDRGRTDLRGDALPRVDVPVALQLEGSVAGGADHGRAVRRGARPLGARRRPRAARVPRRAAVRDLPVDRLALPVHRAARAEQLDLPRQPTSTGAGALVELVAGALLAVAFVLWLVRLASVRWQPSPRPTDRSCCASTRS